MKNHSLILFILFAYMLTSCTSFNSNVIPRTSVSLDKNSGRVNTPFGSINANLPKIKKSSIEGQFIKKKQDVTYVINVSKNKKDEFYQVYFVKSEITIDTLINHRNLRVVKIGNEQNFVDNNSKIIMTYKSGIPNGVLYEKTFYKQVN